MSTEEQPKQERGERWVSGTEWLVCSLVALLSAVGNARSFPGRGIPELLGNFIGSLVMVVLFWVTVRGIYRWITQKRSQSSSGTVLNFLLPFRSKYRELGLSKQWWHRLAIVLFSVALSAGFLMSVFIFFDDANGALWSGIGYTLGFLISLSYVLQLLYRAVIYVVYGNKREPEHSSENAV